MELKEYREQIDRIDAELVRLFQERMKVSAAIGQYKKENGLPVLDRSREREKLSALLDRGKRALDHAGIEIPYPQMDVHIRQEDKA